MSIMKHHHEARAGFPLRIEHRSYGFTLIEILVVIAILGILSSIALTAFNNARVEARDSERAQTLKSFALALELYYSDYGVYPTATSTLPYSYSYVRRQSDGTCLGAIDLHFDNSADGFLQELYSTGYLSINDWNDPLFPSDPSDVRNCRYVIPCSLPAEQSALCSPQSYLLHCNLEDDTYLEANDSGGNPTLFEVTQSEPWICVTGTYN